MRRWISSRRGVATVAVCLVGLAVPAAAQDEAFKRGADLLRSTGGDVRAAAESMREAIKQDGREARRVVGGNVVSRRLGGGTPYLPHYFLGEALMRAGDCAGAVSAWEVSLQQKVVFGEYLDNLRKGSAECEKKGILPEQRFAQQHANALQVVSSAGEYLNRVRLRIDDSTWQAHPELVSQYTEANAHYLAARSALDAARSSRLQRDFAESHAAAMRTNNALARLEATLTSVLEAAGLFERRVSEIDQTITGVARQLEALGTALSPALVKERQNAGGIIDRARERLGAGKKAQNPAFLDEARTLATTASSTVDRIRDQLRQLELEHTKRRFDDVLGAASRTFQSFDESMVRLDDLAARRADRISPDVLTERDTLRKTVLAVRRRFDAARAAGDAAAVAKAVAGLEAERPRLNALLGGFGPLTLRDRGVPAVIEDGLRLFLDGEHDKVVKLLSNSVDPSVPLAAHAYLLRAGSLYTLFIRSGEKDQSLLAAARQEVARSRQVDPSLQPDTRVFSRRLITFFQTPTAAPAPP